MIGLIAHFSFELWGSWASYRL